MNICQECRMVIKTANEYHPYAACLLFRACGNGDEVRAHLTAILQAATRDDAPSADAELEITDFVAKELWLVWNAASASSWENVTNKEKYRYPARKAIEAALGWKPRSEWTIGRDEMKSAPLEGWELVETQGFDDLIEALDRADSKGYLPDAMREAWESFQCRKSTQAASAPKEST